MLNYLYAHFVEEQDFAAINGITRGDLTALIDARVFPAPSYIYTGKGRLVSFVSNVTDGHEYRFHLKGHSVWLETVQDFALKSEDHARAHFFERYDKAKHAFFASALGQQLSNLAPDVQNHFDSTHAHATWAHFLNGVYGVCTRDGQPDSVFKKQAYVMFIEHMIAGGLTSSTRPQLEILERAVDALDKVESDFAPHEVSDTSRQRCIIDVRAAFQR